MPKLEPVFMREINPVRDLCYSICEQAVTDVRTWSTQLRKNPEPEGETYASLHRFWLAQMSEARSNHDRSAMQKADVKIKKYLDLQDKPRLIRDTLLWILSPQFSLFASDVVTGEEVVAQLFREFPEIKKYMRTL